VPGAHDAQGDEVGTQDRGLEAGVWGLVAE